MQTNQTADLAPARLLIVDDEVELMTGLCDVLPGFGFETKGATSGAAALEALKAERFDLLLTDMMMPGMDGIELIRVAKALDPNLICLLMTGQGSIQTAVEALKGGAFDYVLKPFQMSLLLPTLERALKAHRLRSDNLQMRETLAVYELSMGVAQSYNPEDILAKVLEAAVDITGADEASIMQPTPAGTELRVTTVRGGDREALVGETAPLEQGVAGWVARNQERVVLESEVNDARFDPVKPRADILSALSLPLIAGGRSVGVLNLNRKRAEAELQQTNELLRNAFAQLENSQQQLVRQERLRALGEMASEVAHDFNNALSPVLGYSELLLLDPTALDDREKMKRHLEIINTAARDAANVVRRLREFYRTQDDDEEFLPVDLNALVEQAVDLAQPRGKDEAQSRGLDVSVKTELAAVHPIFGHEPELREVLPNLLFNAVDALRPEADGSAQGAVTLRTRAEGDPVALEVSDTGAGMAPGVRERCLDPFFATKGERGTGQGLSMVHGIVGRHRGTIDIESEPGSGTTFILRFPVGAPAEAATVSLLDTAPARPLRVLAVDDEPTLQNLVKEFLLTDGHEVETAVSGLDALEKFRAGTFDLVVTDRAMAEMGGNELAATPKELDPAQPLLMLTGFGELMNAQEGKPAAVDLVIGKPPKLAVFRAAVAKLTA